jgi:subtilase family serine protease
MVNSTAGGFGPTTTPGALPAGSYFVVPALTPGIYSVYVIDQYGAQSASGVYFTITATPVTQVNINAAAYYPMDIISFNIYTTDNFTVNPVVTVRDPSGMTVWMATWTLTQTGVNTWRMLYMDQMVNSNYMQLAADCPLGTWNWTITYTAQTAGPKTATGLFSVVEKPDMQAVLDAIDAAEASISGLITTSEGNIKALINTKSGQIVADIADLDAKITSIDGAIVTLSTTLGEVQTTVDALNMDTLGAQITSIASDVATIKTNLGTVSTNVNSLNAKVTDISDDIATVQTTLGTLQGTVTSIEGDVATIDTSVGSLQADLTDVQGKVDQTPAWIAVVLALVAAVAAIFAVITIRQKIAG